MKFIILFRKENAKISKTTNKLENIMSESESEGIFWTTVTFDRDRHIGQI